MEVWLQESRRVTINKQCIATSFVVCLRHINYVFTIKLLIQDVGSGLALSFSLFHSSPEVSFLKPTRGDSWVEMELCFVGVGTLVVIVVELERPVKCVCMMCVLHYSV